MKYERRTPCWAPTTIASMRRERRIQHGWLVCIDLCQGQDRTGENGGDWALPGALENHLQHLFHVFPLDHII